MTRNAEELCIALLVINLGGTFSNAHGLCRLIARKFEIFECVEIIKGLINNNYVTFTEDGGVKQFFITEIGKEILSKNRLEIIELFKNKFPKEVDLTEQL